MSIPTHHAEKEHPVTANPDTVTVPAVVETVQYDLYLREKPEDEPRGWLTGIPWERIWSLYDEYSNDPEFAGAQFYVVRTIRLAHHEVVARTDIPVSTRSLIGDQDGLTRLLTQAMTHLGGEQ